MAFGDGWRWGEDSAENGVAEAPQNCGQAVEAARQTKGEVVDDVGAKAAWSRGRGGRVIRWMARG